MTTRAVPLASEFDRQPLPWCAPHLGGGCASCASSAEKFAKLLNRLPRHHDKPPVTTNNSCLRAHRRHQPTGNRVMSRTLSTTLKITAATLTLAVAGAALPGTSAPAEGKQLVISVKHSHKGSHHRRHFVPGLLLWSGDYGYYSYSEGCYPLKVRALETGRAYWWQRYYACRGY
jgi:hypothetical protein